MRLVCVHGAGGSGLTYASIVPHFPGAEAVDLPGHPRGSPCSSIEAYAHWLRGYLWGKGYDGVVLMGHSMGGAIVQYYALHWPEEVRGVVLMCTGARLRVHPDFLRLCEEASRSPQRFQEWLDQQERDLGRVEPSLRSLLVEKAREVGPAVQLNDLLCCDRFDLMDRVREIRVPTLVLGAEEDGMTPPKYAHYLAEQIPGAHRRIVPQATHFLPLERPREVASAVEEFLRALGA